MRITLACRSKRTEYQVSGIRVSNFVARWTPSNPTHLEISLSLWSPLSLKSLSKSSSNRYLDFGKIKNAAHSLRVQVSTHGEWRALFPPRWPDTSRCGHCVGWNCRNNCCNRLTWSKGSRKHTCRSFCRHRWHRSNEECRCRTFWYWHHNSTSTLPRWGLRMRWRRGG